MCCDATTPGKNEGRDTAVESHADAAPPRRVGVLARLLILLISLYRRIVSPLLPPRCRFYPTCSAYATTALRRHGALRGFWLTLRRVGKCHPFHPGGIDPVPDRSGD